MLTLFKFLPFSIVISYHTLHYIFGHGYMGKYDMIYDYIYEDTIYEKMDIILLTPIYFTPNFRFLTPS